MEIATLETGSMTRHMVGELTSTWMEPIIVATGRKISNTVMELRPGQMLLSTKAIMNMERSMA